MYSETKDSFFDGLLIAVFNDFFDKIDASPSDEELATLYPVPAHGAKRYIKAEKKSRKKKATPLIILRRAAVIFLAIVSVAFAVLMTNDGIRAAVFETVAICATPRSVNAYGIVLHPFFSFKVPN